MDLGGIPIGQFAQSGAFALLFVWLLYTTQKDSKDRENRLYNQIEKQNEAQERIIEAIERLEQKVENITK